MLWKTVCNAYRSQLPPGKSSPRCSRPQWTLLWRRGSLPGGCVVFYKATSPQPPVTPHTLPLGQSLVCPLPATLVPAGLECEVGLSVRLCARTETFWNMWERRKHVTCCSIWHERGNCNQLWNNAQGAFFVLVSVCESQKTLACDDSRCQFEIDDRFELFLSLLSCFQKRMIAEELYQSNNCKVAKAVITLWQTWVAESTEMWPKHSHWVTMSDTCRFDGVCFEAGKSWLPGHKQSQITSKQ